MPDVADQIRAERDAFRERSARLWAMRDDDTTADMAPVELAVGSEGPGGRSVGRLDAPAPRSSDDVGRPSGDGIAVTR